MAGLMQLVALLFGLAPAPLIFGRKTGHALQLSSQLHSIGIGAAGKICVDSALCIVLVLGAALFATTLQRLGREHRNAARRDWRELFLNWSDCTHRDCRGCKQRQSPATVQTLERSEMMLANERVLAIIACLERAA